MAENIHDKGYKDILSNKKYFLDLLRSFVHQDWVKDIDENEVEMLNNNFVDDDFKEKETDIIYKLKIDGVEVYFYCLLELQSSVDFAMPFRLLRYMFLFYSVLFSQVDKNERERADFRLPVVVPIILYNGTDKWTAVKSFGEYLKHYEHFGEYFINFKYILLDVNSYKDEDLLEIGNLISCIIMFDKKFDQNRFYEIVRKFSKRFSSFTKDEQEDFIVWFRNVFLSKSSKHDVKKLRDMLSELKKGETQMTYALERFADELIEKGRAEGIEKGIEKGRAEGVVNGMLEAAKRFVLKGYSKEEISEILDIPVESISEII